MKRALSAALLTLAASTASAAVPHLDLAVALDPGSRALEADAQFTVAGEKTVAFALAATFDVLSADLDGRPVEVRRLSGQSGSRFEIALPADPRTHVLRLRYRGTLAPIDLALSHRETLEGLAPIASTVGSFLPAGSGWYPELWPLFTWRLTVRTPAGQVAVAPGTLEREDTQGVGRSAVFALERPSQGLDLFAGPYAVVERAVKAGDRTVRIRTYFHDELQPLADGYLEAAARYIARYSDEIAPYPYSDFSIVSSPLPTGFGMPSLTYLGRDVLKLPFIKDTSLGHEVLHNWWGTGVYVDTARGNWSEGLTTFMADYAYKEDQGPDAAREMRHGWLRDYAALAPAAERPLAQFRARAHTASSVIGYGKSAMLFFTLREELGVDRWRAALRDFWDRHAFQTATFDDLAAAFTRAAGADLSGFFRQWLDQTGAPQFAVSQARNVSDGASNRLVITITQHPAASASRVPLRIFHEAGHQTVAMTVSGSAATGEFQMPARATAVAIDPDFTLWRALLPGEAPPILRDAQAAARARLIVLDARLQAQATSLAGQFVEGEVLSESTGTETSGDYRLVIGSHRSIDRWLHDRGLPPRPEPVQAGDAQAWIAPDREPKIVVVSVPERIEDARATLGTLARRLPHLSRYSWLTFENGKTVGRGNWPVQSPRFVVK